MTYDAANKRLALPFTIALTVANIGGVASQHFSTWWLYLLYGLVLIACVYWCLGRVHEIMDQNAVDALQNKRIIMQKPSFIQRIN